MIITNTNSTQVFDAILRTNNTYAASELQVSLLREGNDTPSVYTPTGIVYNTNSVEVSYEVDDITLLDNQVYLLTLNELGGRLLFRDKMSIIDRYDDDAQDDRFIIEEDNYSFITTDTEDNFVIVGDSGSGADKHYTHHQSSASATWNVNHNLGKFSSVTVVDSGNTVVQGQIQFVDANNVTLIFSSAFSGRAYFN